MLSVKNIHSSQNQRPAEKFKGSCRHNRTGERRDCVFPYAFKVVFSLLCESVFAYMHPRVLFVCYVYMHFDLKVQQSRALCPLMHLCVFESFYLRKHPSDSNRQSRRENVILFDMLKSSLILSCLRAADRDMDREER